MGSTLFTSFDSVLSALKDTPRLGTVPVWDVYEQRFKPRAPGETRPSDALWSSVRSWMILNDPPRHQRLRGAAQSAFLPAAIRGMRARIRDDVRAVLDASGDDEFDVVAAVADAIPRRTVARMMALPAFDAAEYNQHIRALGLAVEPLLSAAQMTKAMAADRYFDALLRPLVVERRGGTGDDLLSTMLNSSTEHRLTDDEVVANATFMAFAGQETASATIAHSFQLLARQPELLRALRQTPEIVGALADECVRLTSPVSIMFRRVLVDHERCGFALRAGQNVMLAIASANRDEAVFSDPDVVRLDRPKTPPIAAFGGGAHYCLGAPLARVEIEEFLGALAAQVDAIEVLDDPGTWRTTLTTRGLQSLRVRVTRRRA